MTATCFVHVVDDDEAVRSALAFALEMVGFATRAYGDAHAFLAHEQVERGVLISDVRMPGMNGFELTRRLRQAGSEMPVILMSGHVDRDFQAEATRAGASLALEKPLPFPALLAEIARTMANWA